MVDWVLVNEQMDTGLRKKDPIVYGNNHVGVYAWKLKNIIKYDCPIFIKGKLGLWNYMKKSR